MKDINIYSFTIKILLLSNLNIIGSNLVLRFLQFIKFIIIEVFIKLINFVFIHY